MRRLELDSIIGSTSLASNFEIGFGFASTRIDPILPIRPLHLLFAAFAHRFVPIYFH